MIEIFVPSSWSFTEGLKWCVDNGFRGLLKAECLRDGNGHIYFYPSRENFPAVWDLVNNGAEVHRSLCETVPNLYD